MRVITMDFYLTASTGSRIHFPVNPEKIICQTQAKIITFEVISLGEVSLPRGRVPTRFSWGGGYGDAVYKEWNFAWRAPLLCTICNSFILYPSLLVYVYTDMCI